MKYFTNTIGNIYQNFTSIKMKSMMNIKKVLKAYKLFIAIKNS